MSDITDTSHERDYGDKPTKRIRQACLNCRRKKVRCSGEKPECSMCRRLEQTCQYVSDVSDSRGRGSSPSSCGNLAALDNIAGEMNARFSAIDARLASLEKSIETLVPLVSTLTKPHSLKAQGATYQKPGSNDLTVEARSPNGINISAEESDSVPQTYTVLFAADIYFRFCHNQPYSLFHETHFRRRITAGEVPEYLLWAFLATACRYCALPDEGPNGAGDVALYASRAWRKLSIPWDGFIGEQEAVDIVRTILLVASIELTSGYGDSAYMKLGLAQRVALHSKLHLEPDSDQTPTFREERRRTFWALYLQDKLISLSREKFPTLPDGECRLRLPCSETAFREDREEGATFLESFSGDLLNREVVGLCSPIALKIIMASALSRVAQYVLHDERYTEQGAPWFSTSPYAAITSNLLQLELHFCMNEPLVEALERTCFTDGNIDQHIAGPRIYAQALFHLSHCLLHHPFLLHQRLQKLQQRAPMSFLTTAWETCRNHAKSLTELKNLKDHNVLIVSALYGYCIMVAGTIHALAMHDDSHTIREDASELYGSSLKFLHEFSRHWKHAGLMAMRLERFQKQNVSRIPLHDPKSGLDEQSLSDSKTLWKSVDYSLSSASTPPASPGSLSDKLTTIPTFSLSQGDFDFSNFSIASPDNFLDFPMLDETLSLVIGDEAC
ncbi:fungal-specific transcription factor domain-containing protein [Xylogone sp. PMI_703]|nr:fungal-specific transcription factor domain-containing protein [Xylogone sp. PMI_703]